jgi:hypothetical protein
MFLINEESPADLRSPGHENCFYPDVQMILVTPFILDWRKVFGRHYYYKYFFEFDIVQIEAVLRNRKYFLRFRF